MFILLVGDWLPETGGGDNEKPPDPGDWAKVDGREANAGNGVRYGMTKMVRASTRRSVGRAMTHHSGTSDGQGAIGIPGAGRRGPEMQLWCGPIADPTAPVPCSDHRREGKAGCVS